MLGSNIVRGGARVGMAFVSQFAKNKALAAIPKRITRSCQFSTDVSGDKVPEANEKTMSVPAAAQAGAARAENPPLVTGGKNSPTGTSRLAIVWGFAAVIAGIAGAVLFAQGSDMSEGSGSEEFQKPIDSKPMDRPEEKQPAPKKVEEKPTSGMIQRGQTRALSNQRSAQELLLEAETLNKEISQKMSGSTGDEIHEFLRQLDDKIDEIHGYLNDKTISAKEASILHPEEQRNQKLREALNGFRSSLRDGKMKELYGNLKSQLTDLNLKAKEEIKSVGFGDTVSVLEEKKRAITEERNRLIGLLGSKESDILNHSDRKELEGLVREVGGIINAFDKQIHTVKNSDFLRDLHEMADTVKNSFADWHNASVAGKPGKRSIVNGQIGVLQKKLLDATQFQDPSDQLQDYCALISADIAEIQKQLPPPAYKTTREVVDAAVQKERAAQTADHEKRMAEVKVEYDKKVAELEAKIPTTAGKTAWMVAGAVASWIFPSVISIASSILFPRGGAGVGGAGVGGAGGGGAGVGGAGVGGAGGGG